MKECPTCGGQYERLGQHMAMTDHRPPLDVRQRAVVEYLTLIGVQSRTNTTHIRFDIYSTDRRYIEWLTDMLGWLANEPRIYETAEETAQRAPVDSDVEYWRDTWAVSTLPHPELDGLQSPEDIESLTDPTALLFAQDRGVWVGGPIGTLWLDCRSAAVDGSHMRDLLHERGLETLPPDHKSEDDSIHRRSHWDPDIVEISHYDAQAFMDSIGLDMMDIETLILEPNKSRY